MGTSRDVIDELLDGLIDFGSIEGTALGDSDGVEATIRGAGDGASHEEREGCEVWGLACVQYRPAAGTEVLLLRRGDEIVGLCTKDRRIAVTLDEGEAVITNLSSSSPARVRLRADGEVWIEAEKIRAMADGGDASTATKALALAELVKARLDTIQSTFDAHTHPYVDTSDAGAVPSVTSATTTKINTLASVESARLFTED